MRRAAPPARAVGTPRRSRRSDTGGPLADGRERDGEGVPAHALVLQARFGRSARQEVPGMTDVSEVEGWAKGLDEVMARLAPRFGRVEPRRRALVYLRGLLAPVGRKNGWQLAEAAGDRTPDGMQDFLSRMRWDADAVRDDLRAYVVEHL